MTIVRPTMTNLIDRTRLLVNDPRGTSQIFDDSDYQDVLDAGRTDVLNHSLRAVPTFTSGSLSYLNYYAEGWTDWEEDYVFKQYLSTPVTPSTFEPIAGHFVFAVSTLPPVSITGKSYDLYRAAADLLERWAAKWVLSYSFSSYGQTFSRAQAATALERLSKLYRQKQRPTVIVATRSDIAGGGTQQQRGGRGALNVDYYASGNG
jgi:hypothetical protein